MKIKFLYAAGLLAFGSLVLMSKMTGPANNGLGDRTDSPVASGTCQNCHSGGTFTFTPAITIKDGNGNTVSSYMPSTTYTITVDDVHQQPSNPPVRYGFQCVAMLPNNTNAGDFSNPGSNMQIVTGGNFKYAEHNNPDINGTFEWTWTSPAAATDTVTFYAYMNGVNNSSSTSGDRALPTTTKIAPATGTAINNTTDVQLNIFPNPATEYVQVSISNAAAADYTARVYDMLGREWLQQTLMANNEQVNLRALPAGHYTLRIFKDGEQVTGKVLVKQ